MIKFGDLLQQTKDIDYKDLNVLFESLDRQTSHTEIRPAQKETLDMLSSRRGEKDLVLKVSTGAGKTTVGLIYLYSHMKEKNWPVVYLCPTNQLVEQVCAEAPKLGIKAVRYPQGQPHPGVEALQGEAIIVCTYDKLFNARTTFNRDDVLLRPCAIVLDDAHAGVEIIRKSFTLSLKKDKLEEILEIFDAGCSDYKPGCWEDIKSGDPLAIMEVPFWIWQAHTNDVRRYINSFKDESPYCFVWPHLKEILTTCRCVISGEGVEILPYVMPVDVVPAYSEARHRMFMTATLADESILVRELGCLLSAATSSIVPNLDRGLGERMVIAPSLVDSSLNRQRMMELCGNIAKHVNVVVISPKGSLASQWTEYGASYFSDESFDEGVRKLKDPESGVRFAVFSQRYDGVDLADSACRVLVIDGMPYGEGIVDKYDASLVSIPGGARSKIIYRIEQGMGRAVRSHVDYAVVLLIGNDLANFIAKRDVLMNMNQDSRNQLKLGLELSKLMSRDGDDNPFKNIWDTMFQCLNRDDNWKKFYKQKIKDAPKEDQQLGVDKINMAYAERRAYMLALGNDPGQAVAVLRDGINSHIVDDKIKGMYLQLLASYTHLFDSTEAFKIQGTGYQLNTSICKPPITVKRPLLAGKSPQAQLVEKWFGSFENPNGALAEINSLKSRLDYNKGYKTIEKALYDLATLVGAEGSRPEDEFGEGPDVLWLCPEISLVIEAKNQNEKTLHKRDSGQLLISLQWFGRNYPLRDAAIPVIAAKVSTPDRYSDYPDNTRVITQDRLFLLLENLEKFYYKLINEGPLFATVDNIREQLNSFKLSSNQFISTYTVPLEKTSV